MRQPRPASPSEDHHEDERKLHLAENLWKALVFVFAEIKAVLRFIWRSPHHFDAFIHWLDTPDKGVEADSLETCRWSSPTQ